MPNPMTNTIIRNKLIISIALNTIDLSKLSFIAIPLYPFSVLFMLTFPGAELLMLHSASLFGFFPVFDFFLADTVTFLGFTSADLVSFRLRSLLILGRRLGNL